MGPHDEGKVFTQKHDQAIIPDTLKIDRLKVSGPNENIYGTP